MQSEESTSKVDSRRYITGLDGIRALAVIGVIIFHLLPRDIKGGYLGVAVFFVVSGYLITDLLLKEWHYHHSINVWSFYYRRIRRLYPALMMTIFATGAYMALFQREMLRHLGTITWTNLLYVYNWWEIGHGQNYFDQFPGASPFTHLWSLSIEGQFYFFWPVVLLLLLRWIKNRETIVIILSLISFLSALWMAYLYHLPTSINRIYYGTDTRLFSILFGAILAFIWPAGKLKPHLLFLQRWGLNLLGLIGLLTIIGMMVTISGTNQFNYNGGMLLISLATVMLVASCVHPGANINRWLTNPIFSWIGTRSYGIYLYQFPVMIFYETRVTLIGQYPLLNAGIEIILIMVISELSYRLIEQPLRHYRYHDWRKNLKHLFSLHQGTLRSKIVAVMMMIILAIWANGVRLAQSAPVKNHLQTIIKSNQKQIKRRNTTNLKHTQQKPLSQHVALTPRERRLAKTYGLNNQELRTTSQLPITAIGDSILADSSVDLQKLFPKAYISAAVGRQVWQAGAVIKTLRANNELAHIVVINLGTNSPIQTNQLDQVINSIGPKHQIYWVNCHIPTRYWEQTINQMLAKAQKQYHNVHIIDWYATSLNHPEYFWEDHIHPNPQGNVKFAALIAKSIATNQIHQ